MVKGKDKVSAWLESGTADVYPVPFKDFVIVRRIAETEGEYSDRKSTRLNSSH